jgi:hypothetical protein
MKVRKTSVIVSIILGGICIAATGPALALSMKECSAKYKAAQAAGTLNGQKWNDFRKAQCGSDAAPPAPSSTEMAPSAAVPATSSAPPPPAPAAPATPAAAENAPATSAPPPPPASADVVFPSAIAQKYAGEAAGKARMHTCLDQYNANKAGGGNGNLKWIQKGGGYFSECSKRLKGSS